MCKISTSVPSFHPIHSKKRIKNCDKKIEKTNPRRTKKPTSAAAPRHCLESSRIAVAARGPTPSVTPLGHTWVRLQRSKQSYKSLSDSSPIMSSCPMKTCDDVHHFHHFSPSPSRPLPSTASRWSSDLPQCLVSKRKSFQHVLTNSSHSQTGAMGHVLDVS